MKKAKISPLKSDQNKKVVIDEDEYTDSGPVELICPTCHTTNTIVTLTDQAGNSDKFCKRCSIIYNEENDIIRHRQRLLPPDEPEPTATSIQYDFTKDVEIWHPKELRGGIAELQKRRLKITYFEDSSQR